MYKRMIVLKKHDWLQSAARSRSFSAAESELEEALKPRGFKLDPSLPPIPVKGATSVAARKPSDANINVRALDAVEEEYAYVIRADFENESAAQTLLKEHPDDIAGIYVDPHIYHFNDHYCPTNPQEAIGDSNTVAEKLGVSNWNLTGKNVKVAVVDTGIAKDDHIKVERGWSPPGVNVRPGESPRGHGTMCAFDVLIAAPDAELLDYALLQSTGQDWTAFLSDGVAAFASLLEELEKEPRRPLVVNNSWGLYDTSEDLPPFDPGNYSSNPNHPFTQISRTLVNAGADVLFAAGNCGTSDSPTCSDSRCGPGNVGPGASIHGCNGSPDVITVVAITTDHRRLGYSSQGPAGLCRLKPDITAYSSFKGSGVRPRDGGTSAACPVAAGVVAALREKFTANTDPAWDPHVLKALIQRTASPVNRIGFSYDFGFGIINGTNILNGFQ